MLSLSVLFSTKNCLLVHFFQDCGVLGSVGFRVLHEKMIKDYPNWAKMIKIILKKCTKVPTTCVPIINFMLLQQCDTWNFSIVHLISQAGLAIIVLLLMTADLLQAGLSRAAECCFQFIPFLPKAAAARVQNTCWNTLLRRALDSQKQSEHA